MQEQTLAAKQEFLSKQILEDNFDPEQFQQFMLEQSEKELDLSLWSMKQLKAIVAKFKNKNVEEQESDRKQENQSQLRSQVQQFNGKFEEDQISMAPSVNSSLYKHHAYVKKTVFPDLYVHSYSKQPPEVKITSYQKEVPNNIFQSSYIQYQISTSNGWKVKRRFSDFLWLHRFLRKAYLGLPIPPIPEKTALRYFDDKHIENRMMIFEKFLTTLFFIPELCSDPILQLFLKIQDHQQFLKIKQQNEEKLQLRIKRAQIHCLLGQQQPIIEESSIEASQHAHYQHLSRKYLKIGKKLQLFEESISRLAKQASEISSSFHDISKQIKEGIMPIFGDFMDSIGKNISNLSQFLKEKITSVWNYQGLLCYNITLVMENIRKQQISLNSKHKSLQKVADLNDQSFVNSLEPSKALKQYQISKQKYRTKLSFLTRELKRYEMKNFESISYDWSKSLKIFSENTNQLMISTADLMAKTISLTEGKKLVEVQYIKEEK